MASIERTAYPRFKPSLTADELQTLLQVPIIPVLGTSGQEFTLDRRGQGAYKKVEALLSEPIFTLLPTGI